MSLPNYLGTDRYIGVFDLDGSLKLRIQAAKPTPAPEANSLFVYSREVGGVSKLFYENDAGSEIDLSGGLTGTGINNRITVWTGTTTLGANAALTSTRVPFADANGLLTDFATFTFVPTTGTLQIGGPTDPVLAIKDNTAVRVQLAVATGAGFYSDVAATNDPILRAITAGSSLILTSRNSGGLIKLASGSPDTVKFQIGSAGQWGIGGATYGSAGNYFRSAGALAAPTWQQIAASEIGSGAALTKTNDTNVTLTLGGSPTTALLAATSLTLGWTGTLAATRGGTGVSDITTDWLTQYALLAGRAGGQALIGGSAVTDALSLQGTSGNGTLTSNAIVAKVGNAGATTAVVVLNNGKVGIGSATTKADLQIGSLWSLYGGSVGGSQLASNLYNDGSWKYLTSAPGVVFDLDSLGGFNIYTAPSGTADSAATLTSRLNLKVSGETGIRTTSVSNISLCLGTGGLSITDGENLTWGTHVYGANIPTMVGTVSTGFDWYPTGSTSGQVLALRSKGLLIGTTSQPSTGTFGLIFGAGTALATMAAGTAGLYAQTVSGVTHLIAIASDGTTIQLV